MRQIFAHDVGALLCLGENECALQNRLDEVADTFRTPRRIRRIELFRSLNILREERDMGRHALVAGSPNVGMRGIGFLHQRPEQAGIVRQLAAQNFSAEIDVAEQPLQRVG